jgi:hypothetical protein
MESLPRFSFPSRRRILHETTLSLAQERVGFDDALSNQAGLVTDLRHFMQNPATAAAVALPLLT